MIVKKDQNAIDLEMRRLTRTVRARLENNKRVRRKLPNGGRIHIDRPLPFLCVYRQPVKKVVTGTEQLVMSEASYIVTTGDRKQSNTVSELILGVSEILKQRFGACMVLEIWAGPPIENDEPISLGTLSPAFKLITSKQHSSLWFGDRFQEILSRVKISKRSATVQLHASNRRAPPRFAPLLSPDREGNNGYHYFGLEVSPIYRNNDTEELFPLVLRELKQSLSRALRSVFFDFARTYTKYSASHRHALGRRAMVKAVWEADRILAEVSSSFDFLLQVTPVNSEKAWQSFQRRKYNKRPLFQYRPSTFEPIVLKRKLYRAPVEKIEDPALAFVFRQKLTELDRQITLLQDRNTPRFILESSQLYGDVGKSLTDLATDLLEQIPSRARETASTNLLDAKAFAMRAREEIGYYKSIYPGLTAKVQIRDDISGLMVSQGSLLISRHSQIPLSRTDALLQHEIGTHVLTYHNGKAQPLRQLCTGLAGYDAIQEGLAVLSEYLVGGLSRPRIRLLAGRVIAARNLLDGADFIENFRVLYEKYGFNGRTAYTMVMRTHRGGGLTKDAVYLDGLRMILKYIAAGGDLDPLFVGKMNTEHVPIIRELQWRGVLVEPPLKPRYLQRSDVASRLERVREGMHVLDLI